ncbi:MFS transporter [Jannaschia aquimarina]|uniref:SauU protein n=1 Tax=Jannaschia aquimarina TaxID=935700 RepID=A0A0D1EFU1_9RHOB|nr:MFS transporter [Jannaschia aquimarina]KIT16559.1 putative sulfoacetate transporter SauU [Jannaschia aquimarina]SNT41836.1 Sugar phosphate permease [Jannaschia aquimarina]
MTETPSTPIVARSVLIACIVVFALSQFQRAAGGVFGPVLGDRLDLTATALGLVVGTMFVANLAAQGPAGAALDRFGPRRVLAWSLAVIGAGTLLFALAPSLGAAAWPALVAARVLVGMGMAGSAGGVQVALARFLPPGDYGYGKGLLVSLGGIGGLLGTWPLSVALERMPWSVSFVLAAGLAATALVIVLRAIPEGAPLLTSKDDAPVGYLALLRDGAVLRILELGAVAYAPITTVTGLWGGPYLQSVHGLSPEAAGKALMGLYSMTIAAGFAFGWLDRTGRARAWVVVTGAIGSAACLASLALLPSPGVALALALLASSVFLQQFYIPLGVLLRDAVPPHALGRANALMILLGVGMIPAMQTGFGAALDVATASGFETAAAYRMAFAIVATTIAAALVLYSWPRKG